MTYIGGMDQPAPQDEPDAELHPDDAEWLRRRSAIGPLALGVIGLALSPLLLGLILGPLGMRAGIDLWRAGTRRTTVAVGIAASFCAVVLSVIAALIWGSVLSTVLLGRDAMRVTEGWRGERIEPAAVPFLPSEGTERTIVLLASGGNEPCRMALAHLAEALPSHAGCRLVLVDTGDPPGELERDARALKLDAPVLAGLGSAPIPLSQTSAFPTIAVIDHTGRIETALVGARPVAEIEKLLSGAFALGEAPAAARRP